MVKSIEGVFALLLRLLVPKVWDFFFFLYNIHGLPVRKFFGVKRKPLRPSLYSLSFWGWVVSLGKSGASEYTNRRIWLVNQIKLDFYIDIRGKIWIQYRFGEVQMNLSHSSISEPLGPHDQQTSSYFFLLPCRPERHLRENILTPLTGNRWPLHDFNPTPDCFLLWASSSRDTELQREPPAGVESLILSWIIVHARSAEERDS